jgi:hypothetical protein
MVGEGKEAGARIAVERRLGRLCFKLGNVGQGAAPKETTLVSASWRRVRALSHSSTYEASPIHFIDITYGLLAGVTAVYLVVFALSHA